MTNGNILPVAFILGIALCIALCRLVELRIIADSPYEARQFVTHGAWNASGTDVQCEAAEYGSIPGMWFFVDDPTEVSHKL